MTGGGVTTWCEHDNSEQITIVQSDLWKLCVVILFWDTFIITRIRITRWPESLMGVDFAGTAFYFWTRTWGKKSGGNYDKPNCWFGIWVVPYL